ncbi:dodecenoyl-CoA isomerase [Podochytrium sp. JEL0797]|nr:dodecenoyl-CoA isomerase [Podochytrium sp. JEL0797]
MIATRRSTLTFESDGSGTTHILWITLNSGPVNLLSRSLVPALTRELDLANADPQCRGIILASAVPKVFSAGLDLTEFLPSETTTLDSTRQYASAVNRLFATLASSSVPVVTIVNGAAPAGGAVMALLSDYKIASRESGGFQMGLNETR